SRKRRSGVLRDSAGSHPKEWTTPSFTNCLHLWRVKVVTLCFRPPLPPTPPWWWQATQEVALYTGPSPSPSGHSGALRCQSRLNNSSPGIAGPTERERPPCRSEQAATTDVLTVGKLVALAILVVILTAFAFTAGLVVGALGCPPEGDRPGSWGQQ